MKQLYIDEYGQIWERVGDMVWKPDTGWGLWLDGKGLERYEP